MFNQIASFSSNDILVKEAEHFGIFGLNVGRGFIMMLLMTWLIFANQEKKLSSQNIDSAFIFDGNSNWKNATDSKKGFTKHMNSQCFKDTVLKVITLSQATLDVGETLSHLHRKEKAFNRQKLLKIISNIRFLARKGPAIRGDGLEMGREADSYFTRLMHLRGEDDPRLLDWKTRKSNK